MTITLKSFKRALGVDDAYLSLLERCKSIEATVPFANIAKEAKILHASRLSPKLYKIALQPTPLYEALTKDLQVRARLSELRLQIHTERSLLTEAVAQMKKYLRSEYAEYLSSLCSNQSEKTSLVDRALTPALTVLKSLDTTDSLLDVVILDLDKAAYGLTNSVNILKLLLERRDQVV